MVAERIVSFGVRRGRVPEHLAEGYVYGVRGLIATLRLTGVYLVPCILMGLVQEGIVMMLFTFVLRMVAGGIHFASSKVCFVFSLCWLMGMNVLFSLSLASIPPLLLHIIFGSSVAATMMIGPVEAVQKPLSAREYTFCRTILNIVLVLAAIVYVLTIKGTLHFAVAYAVVSVLLLQNLAMWQKRVAQWKKAKR